MFVQIEKSWVGWVGRLYQDDGTWLCSVNALTVRGTQRRIERLARKVLAGKPVLYRRDKQTSTYDIDATGP